MRDWGTRNLLEAPPAPHEKCYVDSCRLGNGGILTFRPIVYAKLYSLREPATFLAGGSCSSRRMNSSIEMKPLPSSSKRSKSALTVAGPTPARAQTAMFVEWRHER
jgi:hypothetical protein